MKGYRHLIIIPGIIIALFIFMNSVTSTSVKTKKKQTSEFVKLHPSLCEYYIDFETNCPYDLGKKYLVELEFKDYKNRDVVVIADTINDAHKVFLKEKLIYLLKNHQ